MNWVVVADVHAHNFAMFANPVEYYGNTRLRDIVRAIDHAGQVAAEHKAKLVVVGDLFHTRGIISVTVQRVVQDALLNIHENYGVEIYLVAGNHDQANKLGTITSIDLFGPSFHVCTQYHYEAGVAFLPFRESKDITIDMFNRAADDGAEIVFAHAAVNGAFVGDNEYQPKEQLEVKDIQPERFKWVFMGHYHRSQMLAPNTLYCGSLVGHNFSDNDDRGFWVLADGNLEFVNSKAPRFRTILIQEAADLKRFNKLLKDEPDDFYKLKVMVDLKLPEFEGNVIIEKKLKVEQARLENLDKLTEPEIIKAYCDTKGADSEVIQAGLDILNSVK